MPDYFVSAAGSDSNDGSLSSPWKTINRVNAAFGTLGLNNRVLFRRGDTFYGVLRPPTTLNPASSGWLKIGAYGDGAKPVITGYKMLNTVSGWVQHDANTWKIDYSAANSGVTYTGYDSAKGDGDVGFLKVDGVIKGVKKSALADLSGQWDFYSSGTTLYVRSTAKPTSLAGDVRCTVNLDGVRALKATEISDLTFVGHGGVGVYFPSGSPTRCRLLRCDIGEIGGSYLTGVGDGTVRYGNGVTAWVNSNNIYCEHNTVYDCFDTAWSIQGGSAGVAGAFTDVTWRRNLTYRNSQAEEYWYLGTGAGFVNCVSEYNTNLYAGYGWGADVRPNPDVRVALLTYNWGNPSDLTSGPIMRRNIYYDARAFSFNAYTPTGMESDRNVVLLRPGTKMNFHGSETVEQAAQWASGSGMEQNSLVGILSSGSSAIGNSDVTDAISGLDVLAPTGQRMGGKAVPIHWPWRT